MLNNKIFRYFIIALIAVVCAYFFFFDKADKKDISASLKDSEEIRAPKQETEIQDRRRSIPIGDKDTYGELMEAAVGPALSHSIYTAASSTYDLANIRSGRELELTYEEDSDVLKQLVYKMNSEDELVVRNGRYYDDASSTVGWKAFTRAIPYKTKIVVKEGEVESSMYKAAMESGIDERAIIQLANTFQWTIDFAMDPRKGDEFKFIYEERYLGGEYKMPGRVIAGYYVNDGKRYEIYYFEENEKNKGYFDAKGNSVQKMFLKAPVAYRYISSGYTTGNRVIMEFGLSGPHRAIDYAAPVGTPIRSVGDGTVVFAGWKTGYGYITSIRHNGTYTTNYAHQNRIAVGYGQKVKQGETIGYVGNTGYSTGPHLHYEMIKNGVKINPLNEILPPGEPIAEENMDRFFSETKKWRRMLQTNIDK